MAVVLPFTGLTDYQDAHLLQQELLLRRIADDVPDVVLMLQHEPVITVGRSRTAMGNVLDAQDTPVLEVERGGDVTWHGPGQLVAYPILKLEGRRQDLRLHMRSLEDAVIRLLSGHQLAAQRDDRNTGVWLPDPGSSPQKVCSVGVACRRWVSWHGLALNVDVDLTAFRSINPCGFRASVMTRLADHLDPCPSVSSLMAPLADHLLDTLNLERSSDAEHASMRRLVAKIGMELPSRAVSKDGEQEAAQ